MLLILLVAVKKTLFHFIVFTCSYLVQYGAIAYLLSPLYVLPFSKKATLIEAGILLVWQLKHLSACCCIYIAKHTQAKNHFQISSPNQAPRKRCSFFDKITNLARVVPKSPAMTELILFRACFIVLVLFALLFLTEIAVKPPGLHSILYDQKAPIDIWVYFVFFVLCTWGSIWALTRVLLLKQFSQPFTFSLIIHFGLYVFSYFFVAVYYRPSK